MIPVIIPDDLVQPGTVRRIIAVPNGDLTDDDIRPVESLISRAPDGQTAQLSMMLELEPGELGQLARGGRVWLTMIGGVMPFNVQVLDEGQVP